MNWVTYTSLVFNGILVITAVLAIRYNRKDRKTDKDSQIIREQAQCIEDYKKQVSELKEQLDFKKRLVMKKNLTYYKQDNGDEVIVCPNCINDKVFPLPMFKLRHSTAYHCNSCGYDIGSDGEETPASYPDDEGKKITVY